MRKTTLGALIEDVDRWKLKINEEPCEEELFEDEDFGIDNLGVADEEDIGLDSMYIDLEKQQQKSKSSNHLSSVAET
jgi:hypothetical protein